jgi:hypothetical protein
VAHRRYTGNDISFFGSVGVRQRPQQLGPGEAILRDHAAIARMRVAPDVGVHAGTVGNGNRMVPVTHPGVVKPRIVAFLRARS